MELHRWTNPHQPQTLFISVFLLYFRAVMALVPFFATTYGYYNQYTAGAGTVMAAIALALAGLGIANDRRWGYRLGVVITALGVLPLVVWLVTPSGPPLMSFVILAIIPVAQLVLLLHPMSREHQRIWFT